MRHIMSKAKFITIEGIEGVGKSTAVKTICDTLQGQHIDYVLTREPGGTKIAEEIRSVLLGHHDERLWPLTELLLMFAGRAQNINNVILPHLSAGKWVVSDRFTDASFAYQGGGRQIPTEFIHQLKKMVQGDQEPDLTILLDAPVDVGMKRIQSRGAKDRIEKEGYDFFNRIRKTYLDLAKQNPARYYVIDATQELAKVQEQVRNCVLSLEKRA